ncbi:MAG: heme ABC transporter ATP-binding protein [Treponema sp. GWB1_62_6]|nr:MAG: heme ABC transporter ATP-binding protein [Treponema sp. GWB1_62_6]OHE69743.1 MAG: heme ABC transporter ATP-binding protein [Treponema sp. GWC1_61_84]OHE76646.1 MAG: heme ABC transporter ATP-binding protein [Treponema sp. RIFOXYC1_FULL_61_9]HCM26755.1 heme ABC transporter ATP-binding protein [Treponema sp.]
MGKFEGVEMKGISKSFNGVFANRDVDFHVGPGEIVGLLGENGAGKTTLMNILYGLYRPDGGEILIGGKPVSMDSPRGAMRAGIGMVHQHFMLVQNHTVAENVVLGDEKAPFFFPVKATIHRIEEFGRHFGLQVNPASPVWQLSAGEQQRVEIVKALMYGAELLILDEPTSVLTPIEVKELFSTLRAMAAQGKAVVIISHKLEEITDVCSRVAILRKGALVGEADPAVTSRQELARMMVGRDVVLSMPRAELPRGSNVLDVDDLHVMGDRGTEMVSGVTFRLYRNEIFGIAGVSGNGQRELVEAITGLRKPKSGSVLLEGAETAGESAKVMSRLGVAHVPEERIKFGIVPNLLIYENAVLKSHHAKPFSDVVFLDYDVIRAHAEGIVEKYSVSAPSIDAPMKNLSGGNIQKLIIGREISGGPALLVASHPTYGLDVGATEYIRLRLIERRDAGGAVLLVSEDLEEIYAICDRVAVMYRGRFMGVVEPSTTPVEDVGLMMAGGKQVPQEALP